MWGCDMQSHEALDSHPVSSGLACTPGCTNSPEVVVSEAGSMYGSLCPAQVMARSQAQPSSDSRPGVMWGRFEGEELCLPTCRKRPFSRRTH